MPPEQLNTIKLPIVSSSKSEALREKMVQKAPTGLHQMALRNLSVPSLAGLKASFVAWLFRVFPILTWAREMTKSSIWTDVIAGITVGVVLIPQSMSYADIAGLQYRYGLYAGFMPTIVYALMGTSHQLAVGPVAMVSLLVNAGLDGQLTAAQCPAMYCPDGEGTATCYPSFDETMRKSGTAPQGVPYECGAEYAKLAFLLSFLVGFIQLGAGVLRAGYLVSFLSHPVVSGFTSGAAVIIGLSQVKYILGYDVPKSQYIYVSLENIFGNIKDIKPVNFVLGMAWLLILIGFKKGSARYPKNRFLKTMKTLGPLTMCVLNIGLMYAAPALKEKHDVKVVGVVPGGLDGIWSGDFQFNSLSRLVGASISISVIGFMESISIAKALAVQHGYKLKDSQELVALGAANVVGSMFSAYPVTGSFSRSAINTNTGAQTALSGLVTALIMLLTITCITAALENLPTFCLGAMVISSVMNLFAYKEAMHLWHVKKSDFICWLFAFLGTIFLGVQIGLMTAIALSLVIVIYESVTPQMSVLWSIPGTKYYRHVKQPEPGNFVHGVLAVRIGASMYFANTAAVADALERIVAQMEESKAIGLVKYIVLDMTPVVTIDSSAIHALEDMNKAWQKKGVQMCFANCGTRVMRTLGFAHFQEHHIGRQWFLPEVHLAVKYCVKHAMSTNQVLRKLSKEGLEGEGADAHDLESGGVMSRYSSDALGYGSETNNSPVPEGQVEAKLAQK
jgi:sulfate transporter 4